MRARIAAVGAVGPFGVGYDAFAAWHAGGMPSCIGPIEHLDEAWLPVTQGGCVPGWDKKTARALMPDRKALKLMTRPVQIGVAATLEAWPEGTAADIAPSRRGMYVGAAVAVDENWTFRAPLDASMGPDGFEMTRFATAGHDVLDPLWLVRGLSNNVLAFSALFRDLQGPNDNFEAGEAGPLLALATAADEIAAGRMDVGLAAGSESLVGVEHLLHAFRHGGGLLPGEAACAARLERGEPGDFGVLGHASGFVPGPPNGGAWLPEAAGRRLVELLSAAEARAGQAAQRLLCGPRLLYVLRRAGAVPLPRKLESAGLTEGIATRLGDAGAGSGALLIAGAASLRAQGQRGPIALAGGGPGGELAVVLVGTLP